ncbi:Lipid A core-O-antigen ligase and related enzymes [uncultured Eubacterium sp.]|nr:Lipid A core-O-antigen ligase and related enzymes [uncultured Eubacterium sp.]
MIIKKIPSNRTANHNFINIMICIMIIASTLGSGNHFSIRILGFNLSLVRCVLLVLIGFALYNMSMYDWKIVYNKKSYNLYLLWSIWISWGIISIIWANDKNAWSQDIFLLIEGFLFYFVFLIFFKTSDDFKQAFKSMLVAMIFHNLIGYFEIFTGRYLFLENQIFLKFYDSTGIRHPISTMSNENDFACLMILSVTVCYICLHIFVEKRWKTISFFTLISSAGLIIIGESRGCILGLAVIIVFYIILQNNIKRKIIMNAVFVLVVISAYLVISDNSFITSDSSYFNDITRMNLIKNSIQGTIDSCGFGVGAGQSAHYMNSHNAIYNTGGIISVHNWWFQILLEYGILFFLIYVYLYIDITYNLFKLYKKDYNSENEAISKGFLGFLIVFIILSVVPSSLIGCEFMWCWWGIIYAFYSNKIYI